MTIRSHTPRDSGYPSASTPRWLARWAIGTLAALVVVLPAQAETDLHSALNQEVRAALLVSTALGFNVVDLTTGETIYDFEGDRLRIIASNTKLLTTAAALDTLGPGYFFKTRVLIRGQRQASILHGDLAVVGGGDPNLSGRHHEGDSLAVFRGWTKKLAELGIERIEGDLYLVNGLFEPPQIHPDWPRDQLTRWYEAPVDALSFNDNCVLVRVWPANRTGLPARIETVPELPLFEVRNLARTIGTAKRHRVAVSLAGSDQLTVSGSVYQRAAPVETWVAVSDPLEYFGSALRKGFAEEGIEIEGTVRTSRWLPTDTWQTLTIEYSDLMTTVEVINKRSQNFYAESLLKLMGAELCGEGSWSAGRRVVAEFLERAGIEQGSYQLADGSGMSRNNRLSAQQLTRLLEYMFDHPRSHEFILTLPFSGEPGLSWEDRLADPPYAGNVFAKTGSLNGVSTLSGYVKARSGKVYAFSILFNETRRNWMAKRAQDRMLKVLVDHG